MIKVSCPYCGRLHPQGYVCERKPKYGYKDKDKETNKFRRTNKWTIASKAIRARDNYLCVWCKEKLGVINNTAIEVHHITKIKDAYDKRLDGDNLISLCRVHHEEAEKGLIDALELQELARKQEELNGLSWAAL